MLFKFSVPMLCSLSLLDMYLPIAAEEWLLHGNGTYAPSFADPKLQEVSGQKFGVTANTRFET
eukprot:3296067-Amphidinium_carterae.1